MKKIISLFFIASLLIGINACNSDRSKAAKELENKTIEELDPEAVDCPEMEDKIVEVINIVSPGDKNVNVTDPEFIEKAKEHYPDIQTDAETLVSLVYKGKYKLQKLSLENLNLTQEMIDEAVAEN